MVIWGYLTSLYHNKDDSNNSCYI